VALVAALFQCLNECNDATIRLGKDDAGGWAKERRRGTVRGGACGQKGGRAK